MIATALRRRWPGFVWNMLDEADALEEAYGCEAALGVVLDRILSVDRPTRRRLYLLHDELARRAQARRGGYH
ncbi:MAG: hypothetical protein ACHP84_14155 [Caulobacterales bacterium]